MESKNVIIGVISFAIMIIVFFFRNRFKHLRKYGYFGILLLALIGNISMLSPAASLVSLVGGRFYNVFLVGLMAATGCLLGEILTYNIGAAAGEIALKKEPWYEPAKIFMEKNGFLTILGFTSIPNPIFNIAALAAGGLGYNFWAFLLASFLGNWLQYTFTAFIGSLTKKIIKF